MNSGQMLEKIRAASKENQRPVTVNLGVIKSAIAEINAHVAVNGKGLMTDMVLNALNAALREGRSS